MNEDIFKTINSIDRKFEHRLLVTKHSIARVNSKNQDIVDIVVYFVCS